MAGDIRTAKQVIRKDVYAEGLCVTIEPTTFIYTGGEEEGFVVGFIDHPKHPTPHEMIFDRARSMAQRLMPELNQRTALLVDGDKTERIEIIPPGQW
jgi:hypothetical protein